MSAQNSKDQLHQFLTFAISQLNNPIQNDEDVAIGEFLNICLAGLQKTKVDEIQKLASNLQKVNAQSQRNVENLKSKFEETLNEVLLQKVILEREVNDLKAQLKEAQTTNIKIQNKLASTTIAKEKLEAKLNNNLSPKKGK
jgi:hypothetical protein